MWGMPHVGTRFPGCNPHSLDHEKLGLLAEHRHVVSLKTDGVRYFLLLTTRADASPVAVMIDRGMTMYEVAASGELAFFPTARSSTASSSGAETRRAECSIFSSSTRSASRVVAACTAGTLTACSRCTPRSPTATACEASRGCPASSASFPRRARR